MVKTGDIVTVRAGRDKGKKGKVLKVFPGEMSAIVEGINLSAKHVRRTREDQQGGIIHKETTVDVSNLMIICPACKKPSRIKRVRAKDSSRQRICKKCGEQV